MFYNIRIQTCGVGYVIQVKKNWWSAWKPVWYGNSQRETLETVNTMLFKMWKKS